MVKQKIIKWLVIPGVGILLLVAYYNVNSKASSNANDFSPIMSAPELGAGAMSVEKKSKKEVYDEALEEEARKKAEWERIQSTNANSVASDFGRVLKEDQGNTSVDYNQRYLDSLAQVEAIKRQLQAENKVAVAKKNTPTRSTPVKRQNSPVKEPVKEEPKRSSFNTVTVSSSSNSTSYSDSEVSNSSQINAVVFGDHTIRNGEAIRIRTTKDAVINGNKIPRNTVFNARTSGSGNRLMIQVDYINGTPVGMKVYDTDNMAGISVPFDFGRTALSDGAGDIVNETARDYTEYDNSVSSSVVRGVTGALTKATKEQKVHIPDGYEIYIRQ